MNRQRLIWLVAIAVSLLGYTLWSVNGAPPANAALPEWTQGEFGASAERYAGRTVRVDSIAIRFSRGAAGVDSLPIERVESIPDVRSHIRIFDLHVQDNGTPSKIRLIASSADSSFRLQTMPDIAWRRLSDREARVARIAALDQPVTDTTVADSGASQAVISARASIASIASHDARVPRDTVIGARRFSDRDPVAREELMHIIAACRGAGCRIGVRGLLPPQFSEFAGYLRRLGADSVVLTAERTNGGVVTMLDIVRTRR